MAFLALCIATEFRVSQAPSVLPCFYMYESRSLEASTTIFEHPMLIFVAISSRDHQFTYLLAQKLSHEKTTIHPAMTKTR